MKSPKTLKPLDLADLRTSAANRADAGLDRAQATRPANGPGIGPVNTQEIRRGDNDGEADQSVVRPRLSVSAFKAAVVKLAPALLGSARKTAVNVKDQISALDLRQRVNDLKRVPISAVPAPVPVPVAVTKPIVVERARLRDVSGRSWSRWTFLLGCLSAAGVAHIVTIFALPVFGSTSAFERLKPQLQVNTMAVLPPAAPGGSHIPFLSPDMRYAMCRYDISSGPVAVSAILPEAGWSLAIHAPDGENFYLVPGQDQRRTDIVFTITRTSERSLIATPGVRRSDVDATQVTSPRPEGLVVLRAPVRGTAYRAETEAILKAATCRAIMR